VTLSPARVGLLRTPVHPCLLISTPASMPARILYSKEMQVLQAHRMVCQQTRRSHRALVRTASLELIREQEGHTPRCLVKGARSR
jgi:hypothetical protein